MCCCQGHYGIKKAIKALGLSGMNRTEKRNACPSFFAVVPGAGYGSVSAPWENFVVKLSGPVLRLGGAGRYIQ